MEISKAYLVLGASREDSWEIIKRKYHQMMLLYHPDTAGEDDDASLFLAQQINEAYALVKEDVQGRDKSRVFSRSTGAQDVSAASRTQQKAERSAGQPFFWNAGENPLAYCERILYEGSGMYDSGEILWHESRRGRFNWDPYKEEFRIFARSINEACSELLSGEERRFHIYDRADLADPSRQDTYRLWLFHLLIQEYIRPALCLDRIAEEHEKDPHVNGKYSFDAAVGLKGKEALSYLAHIRPEDMLLLSMDGERMLLSTREGLPLGHVSFHEDSLYYVLALLLREEGAVMEAQVRKISENRKTRPMTARVSVRIHVRLKEGEKERRKSIQEANARIEELLRLYREELAVM